jgi:hypothetical protein
MKLINFNHHVSRVFMGILGLKVVNLHDRLCDPETHEEGA